MHCPLFTYVSVPFQRAVAKLSRDETIDAEDADVPPELGLANYLPDKKFDVYKFEKYVRQ